MRIHSNHNHEDSEKDNNHEVKNKEEANNSKENIIIKKRIKKR